MASSSEKMSPVNSPSFFMDSEEYLPCFGFSAKLPFFMITVFFFMTAAGAKKEKKEYFVYFQVSEFQSDSSIESKINPIDRMKFRRPIGHLNFVDGSDSIYQILLKMKRVFDCIPTSLNLALKNLRAGKSATGYIDEFSEKLFLLFRDESQCSTNFSKSLDNLLVIFFPDIVLLYEAAHWYRTHEFLFIVQHSFLPHLEIVNEIIRFYLEIARDQLKFLFEQNKCLPDFNRLVTKIRVKSNQRQASPLKFFESIMKESSFSSIGYDFFNDDDDDDN